MRARPAATRALFPALLLLLGSCSGLALAEVAVRVLYPHARDHVLPAGFFAMDPMLGWGYRPDHSVTHRTRYFSATYTTNRLGYRDSTRSAAPTPGRTRVLVFGDSQVFGWGIPKGRRFTDLLETRHPDLEVWNLGVVGYGFDQELLAYERLGARLHGEVIVLFATWYTLERAKSAYLYRKHKPRFVLRGSDSLTLLPPAGKATALTQLAYEMLSPLYLPYFLERRIGAVRTRRSPKPVAAGERAVGDTRVSALDALTEAMFARAARVASSRGQRLVLLTNLAGVMLEDARRVAAEHGFEVVPVELPGSPPEWTFGPEDGHWNDRAHAFVADRLWEGLARQQPCKDQESLTLTSSSGGGPGLSTPSNPTFSSKRCCRLKNRGLSCVAATTTW